MTKRFIGYAEMKAKLGVSRTQIGRMVDDGKLPKPLRLGTHHTSRTVWWEHEVEAAMQARSSPRTGRSNSGIDEHRRNQQHNQHHFLGSIKPHAAPAAFNIRELDRAHFP